MYTNLGTTASYIKLFAVFVVLNILCFSVADTQMCRSCIRAISIHTVIDATLYVIHRIFNRYLMPTGACSHLPPWLFRHLTLTKK